MKLNQFEMGRGLTFRRREKSPALLFEFDEPISFALTSLFVFFPFYAIWLDKKNNVLSVERINPFRFIIKSKKDFYKIVEIPCSRKYEGVLRIIDGQRFKKI